MCLYIDRIVCHLKMLPCVRIYMCIYTRTYIHTYINTYIYKAIFATWSCSSVCVHTYMCVYVYCWIHCYKRLPCVHASVYVHVHVSVYLYIHTYTNTYSNSWNTHKNIPSRIHSDHSTILCRYGRFHHPHGTAVFVLLRLKIIQKIAILTLEGLFSVHVVSKEVIIIVVFIGFLGVFVVKGISDGLSLVVVYFFYGPCEVV